MIRPSLLLLLLLLIVSTSSSAAGDLDVILQREQTYRGLVLRDTVEPQWLSEGQSFWYRVRSGTNQFEYVLVHPETGERRAGSSLADLGLPAGEPLRSSQLSREKLRTVRNGPPVVLTFRNQLTTDIELLWVPGDGAPRSYGRLAPGESRELSTFVGHVWLVREGDARDLLYFESHPEQSAIVIDGPAPEPSRSQRVSGVSPDGRWRTRIEGPRMVLSNTESQQQQTIQTPLGDEASFHGEPQWAPDSSAFVVFHATPVKRRKITLLESSPADQLQPRTKTLDYLKPGDDLPRPVPVLVRIVDGQGQATVVSLESYPRPFTESPRLQLDWAADSSEFRLNYNERGHQRYALVAVNATTGTPRSIVEETSPTFIDYTRKTWRHWLDRSGELLWMSERDGWCHLYLYDARAGQLRQQITRGKWVVRDVLHVDEDQRQLWFLAGGLRPEEDPYHLHLCRVNFDGSAFVQLTQSDGNHHITFSPNRQFFVARWSRVDHPPVHELRNSSDGSLVCVLEQADASRLLTAGWTMPERFVATGRDGKTDIHGVLIKPVDFDPQKSYPVIEDIYAGPHGAFAPKDFDLQIRMHQVADLGAVVVKLDGMGTNHRGKVFHDVCWKNLRDSGFPDRKAWMTAAAATRPWMDLTRVGIYGGSAGGQSAMRALLDHHDFYKVAVADCGCHDNRMDKIWWNEQWLGWPVDASYEQNSNAVDAGKLQGQLLLIVGELDQNVDPSSTLQVVGALQKAGKAFSFMPIIGAGHGAAETPYGVRLRLEFLARHLLRDDR